MRSLADALGLSEDERASLRAAVPRRGATAPEVPSPVQGSLVSTLPSPPTPLVGRERELEEIRGLLLGGPEARLLTLTGGVGKTRLAMAAARGAEDRFPDGVAFVALAPLGDPALVVSTAARSLDLREDQGQSAADALGAHLQGKQTLLVLDNFEHLLEADAEVAHLIEACPELVVMTTSRAPLRVRGEQEYPVPPLALLSSTQNPTAQEVSTTPSGRLFVERARRASPAFELTGANAAAVAAICWRLDGLPLALELAATKVRYLDPEALLPRLDRALSAGWARDLPARQRTMRATLDWSHDLLHSPEKELFRRLSVFAGGFTLEAAEDVCAAGAVEAEDVLVLLGNLVEQSLVAAETSLEVVTRYGMLEPVRQYALERLHESGEEDELRRRHALRYLALAESARPRVRGKDQVTWLARLGREHDNLRGALAWAISTEEAEIAARLGWALEVFWWIRGYQREGRRWIEQVLAMRGQLSLHLQARALMAAFTTAYGEADDDAVVRYSEEVMDLSQRLGEIRMRRLSPEQDSVSSRPSEATTGEPRSTSRRRRGSSTMPVTRAWRRRRIAGSVRCCSSKATTTGQDGVSTRGWRTLVVWGTGSGSATPSSTSRSLRYLVVSTMRQRSGSRRGSSRPWRWGTGRTWRTSWKGWGSWLGHRAGPAAQPSCLERLKA
jgi:predicted ATPase